MASKRIGIIGAGTAGLHLALYLQKHGVKTTIFTDRPSSEYRGMRLLNTVAHHAVTVRRETELGVNFWPAEGYFGHYYYVGTPEPVKFFGALEEPSRAVDYRIYQPKLMDEYARRGGDLRITEIRHGDIADISNNYDLLVVCTGKGPFGQMFQHQPAHSPFTQPQRALCVGLFKGIREPETRAVTMYFSPGAGEMIEIPTLSFNGMVSALVIENHIGGDLEILAKTKYDDNPRAFLDLLLAKLRKHYPTCAERIDEKEFDLANGPLDILQGGVTPTVRNSHVRLDNGKLAVALGDVHAVVDPVLGQGANMASYAAFRLAEEIVKNDVFDERFVEHVDLARQDRVLGATRWTNFMLQHLQAGTPALLDFIGTISRNQALADLFTTNFNYPERQWDCFASVARIKAWCESNLPGDASQAA
ncbi:styrene monooxygenase subunit StyA [Zavarzinia compransoris]|uniref:Monooxygenase n=1 Tax=Zavarzinia compransoris TaxID=1264899 RepID=A0A317DVG5_9PROT|nr:styrene monooxygenase/indole monooxygenase family protein [Zavarzinia compransoris]PWR18668.1 monooxygenase [Zavarzinia compransoris]TDP40086.1 styrene monooxygenase [Zavarzinia compransoris]